MCVLRLEKGERKKVVTGPKTKKIVGLALLFVCDVVVVGLTPFNSIAFVFRFPSVDGQQRRDGWELHI